MLKYPNNEEDVGFWSGDKLIRLLVPVEASFVYNELDQIEKTVEIKSWYDRENLLHDTLRPQNVFLNNVISSKSLSFIRNDPYMEKVLEQKKLLHEHYVNALEDVLRSKENSEEFDEMMIQFLKDRVLDVPNLTPHLIEIFKHFYSLACFNARFSRVLNIQLTAFEKCMLDYELFMISISYSMNCKIFFKTLK